MEEIRGRSTKVENMLSRALGRAFRFGMLVPEVEWLATKRVKIIFRDSENELREEIEIVGENSWCSRTVTYAGDIPEEVIKGICEAIAAQEQLNSKKNLKSRGHA